MEKVVEKWNVNFCGVSIYNSRGGRGGWDGVRVLNKTK